MKIEYIISTLIMISMVFSSCESEAERKKREAHEKLQRIELEEKQKAEEAARLYQLEQQRIALDEKRRKEEEEKTRKLEEERITREVRLEKERREKAIYNRYINNSLYTGSMPYGYCYGSDNSCSVQYCSEIVVISPFSSDVLVTIKKSGKVFRHAYIRAGSRFTFKLPDGIYQPFFYYGKGWNPNKVMKQTSCGALRGGFIDKEQFGKDDQRSLANNILTYELILQQGGNFSTRPSNAEEAF